MTSSQMKMTGERFLPHLDGVIRLEHLHRYFLASELAKDKDVLDLACGEGYGSAILAGNANSVIGVDIAEDVILHAIEHYQVQNLSFSKGCATKIPLPDSSVDLVVSFETIEHVVEQSQMLMEIKRVLRPSGILLISSPNKKVYTDETGYRNPFHLQELYTNEFENIIKDFFPNVRHFAQKIVAGSVISSNGYSTPLAVFSEGVRDDNFEKRRYDLILAGLVDLPDLPNSIFESPESPLDPYKAEEFISQYSQEINKVLEGNEHLLHMYEKAKRDLEALKEEHGFLLQAADKNSDRALVEVANAIANDANLIIQSKHWKRTEFRRRISNSIRKLRGKPKIKWPKEFRVEDYTSTSNLTKLNRSKFDLVPFIGANTQPYITSISMVRNESIRIEEMLQHLCALFDRVIIVDHCSTDNTAEVASYYNGHNDTEVVVLKGTDAGYYQSEYMSAIANALINEGQSDWLFFLDCDEILPFKSASDFHQALVPLVSHQVIHSMWYNLVVEEADISCFQGSTVTLGAQVSRYVKIALNARKLCGRQVKIAQGNHAVSFHNEDLPIIGERAFGLYHIPINSTEALKAKLDQGVKAYNDTIGHNPTEGTHWSEMKAEFDTLNRAGFAGG